MGKIIRNISKCCIWRLVVLILVTIGSCRDYKFTRLLKILDELCEEGYIDGKELIAQISGDDYIPKNYQYFDMKPRDEFEQLVDKADYIISHAGTGSIIPALKKNKKVIMFPRLFKYNEHLDDHQIELSN